MSDKRPTREEALRKVNGELAERPGDVMIGPLTERAIDAVAALFGGFAPEPVKVPRLTALRHEDSALQQFFSFSTEPMDSGGGERVIYLSEEQVDAACARSNAWPVIKERIASLRRVADREMSWIDVQDGLRAILERLNDAEFGVGPDLKS